MNSLLTLAQNSAQGGGSPIMTFVWLAVIALMIASMWKVFAKAGQPGWAAVVPIYNLVVLCKMAGKPTWWAILCLIPVVNIIALAAISIEVAKAFGKGTGFGIGLLLLGFIFYPVLAFTPAQYQGPGAPAGSVRNPQDVRAAA